MYRSRGGERGGNADLQMHKVRAFEQMNGSTKLCRRSRECDPGGPGADDRHASIASLKLWAKRPN
jgi:hypothetical protein